MRRQEIKQKIKECLQQFDGVNEPDDMVSETMFNIYGQEMNEIVRMLESELKKKVQAVNERKDIGVIPAKCNNGEKVPNHSKSPTQVALEVATNQLAEAMDIIDGYLNAGTKDQRKALSGRAKELYRDYYGVYFQNYRDRNKSSNTP